MKIGVFDIETYKDLFVFVLRRYEDREYVETIKVFGDGVNAAKLSDIQKAFDSCEFIVSFNGTKFDLPILSGIRIAMRQVNNYPSTYIYSDAQKIISYDSHNNPMVRHYSTTPEWSAKHFDLLNCCLLNKSLKQWEMYNNLRIEELPYEPDTKLTEEMKHKIVEYCEYDVECTAYLFFKYGFDKGMPGKPTLKSYIELHKVIGDKDIKFDRTTASLAVKAVYHTNQPIPPKFISPLNYIKFGMFNVPDELKIGILQLCRHPELKGFVWHDIAYGHGGAHFAKPGLHLNVHKFDVSSMYGTIIEFFKLLKTPEANEAWSKLRTWRLDTKHKKKENPKIEYLDQALKLVLNSVSGTFRMKTKYGPSVDPAVGEAMCMISQMIITELALSAPDWSNVIEVNTDSVFVTGDINKAALEACTKSLKERLSIEIEYEFSSMIYFRDVNNYIEYDASGNVIDGKGTAYSDVKRKGSDLAVYGELFSNLIRSELSVDWSKYSFLDFIYKYHKSAASKYAMVGGEQMKHKNYYMLWTTRECPGSGPISFSSTLIDAHNGAVKGRWGVWSQSIDDLKPYEKYIDYTQYHRDLDDELELWGRVDLCTTRLSKEQSKTYKQIGAYYNL